MNTSEITLMRRKNLGNYEHIEAGITLALVEGDDEKVALTKAKDFLSEALGLTAKNNTKTAQTKVSTNAKQSGETKTSTKGNTKTSSTTKSSTENKANTGKSTTAKTSKAKSTKAKATKDNVKNALRAYAQAKKSKDMAVEVMHDVTGVKALDEVEEKMYAKLIKALAV